MDDAFTDFKDWFLSKPIFTRTYVLLCFTTTALFSLRVIGMNYFYYTFEMGILKLQLWRILTTGLFFGKMDFQVLFSLYFAYLSLSKVQTNVFNPLTEMADFAWLFCWAYFMMVLISSFIDFYFTGTGFVFAMLYIWCKRRPFEEIRYWFGVTFKSGYFPWIYMAFNVLMGQSVYIYLAGLAIGHLYIFIKDIALVKYRKDYLPTPAFFSRLINKYLQTAPPAAPGAPGPNQYFQGRGYRMD